MNFKRNSVIALYLPGKSQLAIVPELERLKGNKVFGYRTITWYNDTGCITKRHGGGHQKTAAPREMVQKVKKKKKRLAKSPTKCQSNGEKSENI